MVYDYYLCLGECLKVATAADMPSSFDRTLSSEKYDIDQGKDWVKSYLAQKDRPIPDCSHVHIANLNDAQRRVYDMAVEISNGCSPKYVIIPGVAGTGKSYLIWCIIKLLGRACCVSAYTGKAACQVSGQTIHSTFHFGPVEDKVMGELTGLFKIFSFLNIYNILMFVYS